MILLHLLRKVVGKCIQMPLPVHHSRWMYGWMDDIKSIYHTLCVTNYVSKIHFTNFTSLLIFCWFEFGFFFFFKQIPLPSFGMPKIIGLSMDF